MKSWTIVNHWTGGGYSATSLDLKHYNDVIEGNGRVVKGDNTPDDQISTSDGIYGAHTRAFNTKNIGVAVACMGGAKESEAPPNYGSKYPMTKEQFSKMCIVNAQYCIQYDIPVTRETVLMHSEVQPNLGIWQRGKWDINVLPWDDSIVGHRAAGDYMREATSHAIEELGGYGSKAAAETLVFSSGRGALRIGSGGDAVYALQGILKKAGYLSGPVDGDFGPMTNAAVLAFQEASGLAADGVVGPLTWQYLDAAPVHRAASRHVESPVYLGESGPAIIGEAASAVIPQEVMDLIDEADGDGSMTKVLMKVQEGLGGLGITLPSIFLALGDIDPIVAGSVIIVSAALFYFAWRTHKSRDDKAAKALKAKYAVKAAT